MRIRICLAGLLGLAIAVPAVAVEVEPLLATLQSVRPKGVDNPRAIEAWNQLATADARQLPLILAGLDKAGPLGANWICSAVETIADRQLNSDGKLPATELQKFLLDTRQAPRARRLAYELLLRVDPSAQQRLISNMLGDPSLAMRRDAVARLIDQAAKLIEAKQPDRAIPIYRQAFSAARDIDQIKLLSTRLEKLGQAVDLPRHFGFLLHWKVVGPFDNSDEKGYDTVYPPEQKLDLAASYEGKNCPGKQGPVKWIDFSTTHKFGLVDLNKALCEVKEVLAYATTEFVSPDSREVEFRLATYSAVKLWLNGKLIDRHNVYHGGSSLDQYVSRGTLEKGRNVILLKVCQNAQTQSWAKVWQFQLRICDRLGTAVLSSK